MNVEHAAEVTALLREEEPPLGLDETEAICPKCSFAFVVRNPGFSWGVCPDCVGEALAPIADGLVPAGGTPPLF